MKKLIVVLAVFSGILSGCVVYDEPYRGESRGRGDHDRGHDQGYPGRGDDDHHRDGDRR